MRIRDVGKLFAGSCVVYFVVAACSSYSDGAGPNTPAATTPDGASSDTGPSVTDPVNNAMAEGHKSGTRLKLRFYEGTDGSRQFIDFFDTQLQTNCVVGSATADRTRFRCLPPLGGRVMYTDTACKQPAFYGVSKTTDPQPKIATQGGQTATYYQLGALSTPPPKLYEGIGAIGECIERDPTTDTDNYYALGAPIPETTFVEMTIKNE
jgi:hypothetical protein